MELDGARSAQGATQRGVALHGTVQVFEGVRRYVRSDHAHAQPKAAPAARREPSVTRRSTVGAHPYHDLVMIGVGSEELVLGTQPVAREAVVEPCVAAHPRYEARGVYD